MVVKRKLNCDSNGFDFPNIPKAPRSCRRKVLNNDDETQICAIDLLASLAGKLLEESESSSTSTDAFVGDNQDNLGGEFKAQLQDDFNKSCKSEFSDDVSKSRGENTSETCLQFSSSDQTPISDSKKPIGCENKKGDYDHLVESGSITEETGDINVDNTVFKQEETDGLEDVKLKSRVDQVSKLVCRDDDDENYCKYYKLSNKFKSYKLPTRVGNRRIRRSLMSQYGRLNPKLKYFEDSKADCKRKLCYSYNSLKHENIRMRRLSSSLTSDGGLSSESVSNPHEKRDSGTDGFSEAVDLDSKDSHVKFSIKSFRIPELLVEVPETATVGSLKRTVMEAVTALLANGIRVGVLSQGKKVRDDSNTLSQAGLSCREKLGNLGFTLEPSPGKIPVPLSSEDPVVAMPSDSLNLSERSAACPVLESTIQTPIQDADEVIDVKNSHEIVLYKSDIEEPSSDSRALVPVTSGLDGNALDIVPVNKKSKRMELAQRRTRRPFSVSEVEGLVEAVEELGTGRWRDVKLRAFENASHRTYVDLKDKWKTLVHTASISPQQRRGEPVPQHLLDRVLAAHRHWSQHQTKPNGKLHVACALEGPQSQAAVQSNQVGEMVQ